MEQEVLLVEEIVDPEIECETPGRVIVNLRIDHEVTKASNPCGMILVLFSVEYCLPPKRAAFV